MSSRVIRVPTGIPPFAASSLCHDDWTNGALGVPNVQVFAMYGRQDIHASPSKVRWSDLGSRGAR